MSSMPKLFPVEPERKVKPKSRKRSGRIRRSPSLRTSVVEQARRTFAPGQKLPAFIGFILGGFMPCASYCLVHYEVASNPLLWVLVTGGLVYSATSVFKWALQAFQMHAKALGFVILVEGVVTFSQEKWLSLLGLAILVAINGISAAIALQVRVSQPAD